MMGERFLAPVARGKIAFALGLSSLLRAKREPEKHQRFRRAGSTRKGLLAPFRPQRGCRNGKKLAASLRRVAVPSVHFVPWAALVSC